MTLTRGELPGVTALREGFRDGWLTPSQALQDCLSRIDAVDGQVGAIERLVPDQARQLAAESDRRWLEGRSRPLEGIPFGIKDIIDLHGHPTGFGSPGAYRHPARASATCVARLTEAGAIPVAKTRTFEFAAGWNHRTRNPRDLSRSSGGSSSGSAASVSAGMLPLALGTDTGGSIRIPAAWNGVAGLKPTLGAVSTRGIAPLSWTLDHVGPICRTASDIAEVMPVLADTYRPMPALADLHGLRVGVPTDWFFDECEPSVAQNVRHAITLMQHLGAVTVAIPFPALPGLDPDLLKHVIVGAEAASAHAHNPLSDHYGDRFHEVLDYGRTLAATDYVAALRLRALVADIANHALADVDVLVSPTSGLTAPPATSLLISGTDRPLTEVVARNTSIFNITGHPAVTIPCAEARGLPVGLQVVANWWHDARCVRVAQVVQEHLPSAHLPEPSRSME